MRTLAPARSRFFERMQDMVIASDRSLHRLIAPRQRPIQRLRHPVLRTFASLVSSIPKPCTGGAVMIGLFIAIHKAPTASRERCGLAASRRGMTRSSARRPARRARLADRLSRGPGRGSGGPLREGSPGLSRLPRGPPRVRSGPLTAAGPGGAGMRAMRRPLHLPDQRPHRGMVEDPPVRRAGSPEFQPVAL